MLALGLDGATAATLQGCDPHGAGDADGNGTGGEQASSGMFGHCGHGDDGADGTTSDSGDTGSLDVCNLVPEQGPALLDFGRCELMGNGATIGACGNTGVHRRCDAAFLEWCNEQGGDVSACTEDEAFEAVPAVPCGTGPNAVACDVTFEGACDSLDRYVICYNDECTVGACAGPQFAPGYTKCCYSNQCTWVPCGDFKEQSNCCKTVGPVYVPKGWCPENCHFEDGVCVKC